MRAHGGRGSERTLTSDQRASLHPMQIEMLGPPHFGRFGTLHGENGNLKLEPDDRDTCSYCGSLAIDDAIKAFETPGVEYSGSDWKYGWPHKFYLTIPCEPYERITGGEFKDGKLIETRGVCASRSYKFYSEHLNDATLEQITRWNAVAGPKCGIRFALDERGLKYSSPNHGYQASGVVQSK